MFRIPRLATLTMLAALAAATAGCAGSRVEPIAEAPRRVIVEPRSADAAVGGAIADVAMGMVGTRYLYGGTDPLKGFDCSGLVYYAYEQAGYRVPRTSQELFRAARKISVNDADPGDLMFFQDQTKLSHVGIYLGDGKFVHAPKTGSTVRVENAQSTYWTKRFNGARRVEVRL